MTLDLLNCCGALVAVNWLEPSEHPNYPEGVADNTHFNELGARKIAELVLAEIKSLHLDLATRMVKKPARGSFSWPPP